jgi:hypothetical protein
VFDFFDLQLAQVLADNNCNYGKEALSRVAVYFVAIAISLAQKLGVQFHSHI